MRRATTVVAVVMLLGLGLVAVPQNARAAANWDVVYTADTLPPPTFNTNLPGFEGCVGHLEIHDGVLHGNTIGAASPRAGGCFFVNFWTVSPDPGFTVEARLKLLQFSTIFPGAGGGLAIEADSDSGTVVLLLEPNRIFVHAPPLTDTFTSFFMDTTDDFHDYRMAVKGSEFQVYADGILRIQQPLVLPPPPMNIVGFGDGSGVADSDYLLDCFSFTTSGAFSPDELGTCGTPQTVPIDIKPGSDPNSINMKNKGTIPVSILSTPDFDATTEVDKTSLTFGKTGDEESLAKCTKSNEDVNGDGLDDVVCHFNTQDTDFQDGDTEGILKGLTVDGTPIEGSDSVRIVKPS